jgi:hypothetical protein
MTHISIWHYLWDDGVAEVDDSCDCESTWSDGDELELSAMSLAHGERGRYHSWTCSLAGQFLCHETVYKCTIYHQTDKKPSSLYTDCPKSNRDRVYTSCCSGVRYSIDEIGGKWSNEEERVSREDPDGRHGMNGEGSGK